MRRPLLALALSALAAPAVAQDDAIANGSAIGNWVVTCEAVSTTSTACTVRQTLSLAESGQTLLRLIAAPQEDGGALMVAQVPMGVHLPGGAVFRAAEDDSSPQREMIWQSCSGRICEAAILLTADDLAALEAEGSHLFGYRLAPTAEPTIVAVSLADLTPALDAIR